MQAYTCDRREYKVSVSTRGLSAYTANRDYHFQYSQRRDWYTPLSNLGYGQTPAGANKQTEKQDSYLPAYSVRSYNKHAQNEIEENTWMEKKWTSSATVTEAIQSSQQSAVSWRSHTSMSQIEVKAKTPPRFILVKEKKKKQMKKSAPKQRQVQGALAFNANPIV